MSFKSGDIFYVKNNRKINLYKLLKNDEDAECYHVLSYMPLTSVPDEEAITSLDVYSYHAPIHSGSFSEAVLLTNQPVMADDLIGYHEYLCQTQSPEQYLPLAEEYYRSGLDLTYQNKYPEAIDAYSKAIDLFPPFFEAIDNRAFCKMDLGLWEEAIDDFRLSLEENPDSLLAEFSIGECYFKMGEYEKAKLQFEIAHQLDPAHEAAALFLEKVNQLLNKG